MIDDRSMNHKNCIENGAAVCQSHHRPGVFPLGQLVQYPQQVNAGEEVPPAELVVVSSFLKRHNRVRMTPAQSDKSSGDRSVFTHETLCCEFGHLVDHAVRKVQHTYTARNQSNLKK